MKTKPFFRLAEVMRRYNQLHSIIESVTETTVDDDNGYKIVYQVIVSAHPLTLSDIERGAAQIEAVNGSWLDYPDEIQTVIDLCKSVLLRLDLEPAGAIFPCSAMREDIRKALAGVGVNVPRPT